MKLKYFKISEFDSPDKPGSGELMEHQMLERLDLARDIAGFPFIINSGFRTVEHNKKIGGVKNSAHLLGWAVDIHCDNSRKRFELVDALYEAGYTRIGIGSSFVHADCDPEKTNHLIWLY
tara:strand:+ start:2021 stop:2380 length:360 start_codon:yes stop_codon:yes gene_type:complete